jgi:hypothetical protein
MNQKTVKILLGVIFVGVLAVGIYAMQRSEKDNPEITYEVDNKSGLFIEEFARDMGSITRIKISPDNKVMLVSTLTQGVHAFVRQDGAGFVQQEELFYNPELDLPGFPPKETGMTGLVFGANFNEHRDVFMMHTAPNEEGTLKNRITRITLREEDGMVTGIDPVVIFESNVDAQASHQIQGGVSFMHEGESHLLFLIGDAFNNENPQDVSKEAGKLMLIKRDGSNPSGNRPFPEHPKIQALGIRNAYDIAIDTNDQLRRFAIGEAGDASHDRFIYGNLRPASSDTEVIPLNFGWDGSSESREGGLTDQQTQGEPEMVISTWDDTVTPDDIAFIPGGFGEIPQPGENESLVLVSTWGKSGSTERSPGKEIMLGTITGLDAQPEIAFTSLIRRSAFGEGKMGHPLGLAFDTTTNDIYFGDILEGTIYRVSPLDK